VHTNKERESFKGVHYGLLSQTLIYLAWIYESLHNEFPDPTPLKYVRVTEKVTELLKIG